MQGRTDTLDLFKAAAAGGPASPHAPQEAGLPDYENAILGSRPAIGTANATPVEASVEALVRTGHYGGMTREASGGAASSVATVSAIDTVGATNRHAVTNGIVPRAEFQLAREHVIMTETKLGAGQYGEVWVGIIGEKQVAVKTLKVDHERDAHNSEAAEKDFEQEILLLKHLTERGSDPYVVRLLGFVPAPNPLMVTEYAENGALLDYLRKVRRNGEKLSEVSALLAV